MAEIPIQKKTGTNWVPLVLGALVVVALLGWCATRNRNDGTVTAAADSANATQQVPATVSTANSSAGAVAAFVAFVASADSSRESEGNHQRTATGIRLLATALEDLSVSHVGSDSAMPPQSTGAGNARATGAANSGSMGSAVTGSASGAVGSAGGGAGNGAGAGSVAGAAASGGTGAGTAAGGTTGASSGSAAGGTGAAGAGVGNARGNAGSAATNMSGTSAQMSNGGGAVARTATGLNVYTDSMRMAVDRLQKSSANDAHSDDVKAAFSAAVSALEQVNRMHNQTRDVAPLRAIYNQLDSKQPLLSQSATVQRFFEAARDALQGMNTNG